MKHKNPFLEETSGLVREAHYRPSKFSINRTINELFSRNVSVKYLDEIALLQNITNQFPDVSYYQGEINWDVLATHTDYAILRAGQGIWEDPQFRRNFVEARKRNVKIGIYWFYDDRYSPSQQFAVLSKLLDDLGLPDMEIWVDWERSYGGQQGGLRNVVAFMQLIENAYLHPVGMYTGYYWFVEHSNAITNYAQYQYLKSKPLWLAWYTLDILNVKIPPPWIYLRHWQFGTPSLGHSMGVATIEIDMNMDTDPHLSLHQRYDRGETMIVNKQGNVRSGIPAKVWSSPGGPRTYPDLAVNQFVRVDKIEGSYAHITSPRSGWTKLEWLSLTDVVTIPPPPPPDDDPPPVTTLPEIIITETFTAEGYEPQTIMVILLPKQT
jgi:GH25 family lysozyme M1 (1,4-beta-N-acetylmuramidase)